LMTTKYQLNHKTLTDERGYTFLVRSELDYKQVLNSVPLGLFNDILTLKKHGITEYLLDLTEDIQKTVTLYRSILSGRKLKKLPKEHTLGNYRTGVA